MTRKAMVCGAVVAGLLATASAYGGVWNNSSGAAQDFTWTGGGDDNGLFTDASGNGPVSQAGNNLFFNLDFAVDTWGTNHQEDTLHINVHANPGLKFSFARFVFAGSYDLLVPDTSMVDAQASMVIQDLNWGIIYNSPPVISPFATNPDFPQTAYGEMVTWDGVIIADLQNVALDPTDLHMDLSHMLDAMGDLAQINTQQGHFKIEFSLIPEPATLALLALGGLALVRRNR